MRCPKCGYISFDNVTECLKCKKNIKSASDFVKGTTYNATAPAFLNIKDFSENDNDSDTLDLFEEEIEAAPSGGYVDRDLKVLLSEDENSADDDEDIFELKDDAEEEAGEEDEEEEDREIEIDFSKFESNSKSNTEVDVFLDDSDNTENEIELKIPDELNDISDLAPPSKVASTDEPTVEDLPAMPAPAAGSDEIDLDSLDFDLGLDDEPVAAKSSDDDDTLLSLDEIEFSDSLNMEPANKKAQSSQRDVNMDDDLDFDLDLGGISIHKEK